MLEAVFHYRSLLGKCDLGCGLDWNEIAECADIESSLVPAPGAETGVTGGRRYVRRGVELRGLVRGDRINDRIEIVELGGGGLVVRNAPFITRGEEVELVIEGESGDRSYLFRARGAWLRADGEDYRVGLQFVGMPVCLRHAQLSAKLVDDVIDRIGAA
jgi:hypothetical protein